MTSQYIKKQINQLTKKIFFKKFTLAMSWNITLKASFITTLNAWSWDISSLNTDGRLLYNIVKWYLWSATFKFLFLSKKEWLLLYFSDEKFSVMDIDHDLTMIHCHYSIVNLLSLFIVLTLQNLLDINPPYKNFPDKPPRVKFLCLF